MREDRAREAQLLKVFYQQAKDKDRNLVQRRIAKDLGVTQSMVAAWLNGHSRCPDRSLDILGRKLGFDPEVVRPGVAERLDEKVEATEERDALIALIDSMDPAHKQQVMQFARFLLTSRAGKK
jgi:predicted transcriptional regulator